MKTIKMSCSHALIKYLTMQKILINGKKEQLFPGAFGIYGHGNVACIGQLWKNIKMNFLDTEVIMNKIWH